MVHKSILVSLITIITPHRKFLEDCPDLSEDRPDTFYVRASKFKTNEQHRTEET